jgi:hypothetical protein
MSEYSTNERAESVMGRRLSKEDEERGVVPFDFPCELGYWCPTCRIEWDEGLLWSEYASFLWCEKCNFDWPSALCVRVDATPDPERTWKNLGRDAAVKVFLDSVEAAVARRRALDAPTQTTETTPKC